MHAFDGDLKRETEKNWRAMIKRNGNLIPEPMPNHYHGPRNTQGVRYNSACTFACARHNRTNVRLVLSVRQTRLGTQSVAGRLPACPVISRSLCTGLSRANNRYTEPIHGDADRTEGPRVLRSGDAGMSEQTETDRRERAGDGGLSPCNYNIHCQGPREHETETATSQPGRSSASGRHRHRSDTIAS